MGVLCFCRTLAELDCIPNIPKINGSDGNGTCMLFVFRFWIVSETDRKIDWIDLICPVLYSFLVTLGSSTVLKINSARVSLRCGVSEYGHGYDSFY